MRNHALLPLTAMWSIVPCSCMPSSTTETITITSDFSNGPLGWAAGVSDYSVGQEDIIEFESGIRPLPAEISGSASGFFVSSQNRSDDLFVYLKRRIGAAEQLEPNTTYRLSFTVTIASNAPSGCAGVGGAPGEGLYIKVGGSTMEPVTLPPDDDDYYALSVDKGNQSGNGPAGTVIGDAANGNECDDPTNAPYVTIVRTGAHTTNVTTDQDGNLWLLVGTDSAFEGLTQIFYQRIVVVLSAVG
jgi:hypothetical protein